jgi:hypothetical protein
MGILTPGSQRKTKQQILRSRHVPPCTPGISLRVAAKGLRVCKSGRENERVFLRRSARRGETLAGSGATRLFFQRVRKCLMGKEFWDTLS